MCGELASYKRLFNPPSHAVLKAGHPGVPSFCGMLGRGWRMVSRCWYGLPFFFLTLSFASVLYIYAHVYFHVSHPLSNRFCACAQSVSAIAIYLHFLF